MLIAFFRFISGYSGAISKFMIRLKGECVGSDALGNRYYRQRGRKRSPIGFNRERRWVIYAAQDVDGSQVPPLWNSWLHHSIKDQQPPTEQDAAPHRWVKSHQENKTGSQQAWFPPGHTLSGNQRDSARGDYEPWQPS